MDTISIKESTNYYDIIKSTSTGFRGLSPQGILVNNGFQVHIDKKEYGVPRAIPIHSIQFSPREMGILDKYKENKLLYHEMISSTKIFLAKDLSNDNVSKCGDVAVHSVQKFLLRMLHIRQPTSGKIAPVSVDLLEHME
jgi:hypothetical protein